MDRQNHQALRAGIAAILFALILRFRGTDLPAKITETLANIPFSEYFSDTETGRYVGVYTTNPDWRCYTSINENIKNQTLALYVLKTNGEHANKETASMQYEVIEE